MQAISMPPVYGDNYTTGDIGFQFTDNSFVSKGIIFYTGWEAMSDVKVSHSFVVKGPNKCVEAVSAGVVDSPLIPRFNDPHTHVVIRRPVGLTPARGSTIALRATTFLGTPYDFRLIGGMVMATGRPMRWLPTDIYMPYRRAVCRFFHTPDALVCVGLSVKALNAVVEYEVLLTEKYYVYDPQLLFDNLQVFKAWKQTYAPII